MALLAFSILFKKHKGPANMVFSVSLLSTASVLFFDSMSMLKPEFLIEWKRIVSISEAVMIFSWFLFSLSFARTDYWQAASRYSKCLIYLSPFIGIYSALAPMEAFFYPVEFDSEKVLFLHNAGYIFNLILLFYSIVSIINLETTLRSSTGADRWKIKYTIFGAGTIVALNIFYYSHSLLYRSINMNLLPVRTGILLIAIILVGISLYRHKAMDIELTVSRKILYRSLSLIIVGIYLLGLGLLAQGMQYLGPEVGKNVTTFLGFAGAIMVLIVIFSEKLRRKTVVFLNKNFFKQKYDYRKQWLQFTQRISLKHSFDELYAAIATGFKEAIGARGVTLWLKEKGDEEYHSVGALKPIGPEIRPDRRLIEFLKDTKWILDVRDPKCKDIVSMTEEFMHSTKASLIVPLLNLDDLIGFLVLEEGLAEADYNFEDYDLLKNLSKQAMLAILNARLSAELMEAKEMEAMGKLSSFILHDLKNATSMLSLIVQNAREHIDNPEFQRDAIRAISNTAEKMNAIIGKLKTLPKKSTLHLEYSDLGYYVKQVISQLNLNGNSGLSFKELEPVKARFDKEDITKVIINLIINALEATGHQGKVEVIVGTENGMGFVKVSDNGCGMSDEFIEKHLFLPFQTTKKKGLGIGLYQSKVIVEAHSGKLKVVSRKGKGSDFIFYVPLNGVN
ncbi:MAG: PEP-CTERM system histidine kinase PrsK [Nitrospirae bacterium]|nr:PEP-CTERM system histidine kinase PrsK [Nitrospirota bacterium]